MRKRWFWILDAALLVGFLALFHLDWTGLALHEWLGAVLLVPLLLH